MATRKQAQQLSAAGKTQYWLLCSAEDVLALSFGSLPDGVVAQARKLRAREPHESVRAWLDRMELDG